LRIFKNQFGAFSLAQPFACGEPMSRCFSRVDGIELWHVVGRNDATQSWVCGMFLIILPAAPAIYRTPSSSRSFNR